ncbi:hypothetical protein CH258_19100, partial [Rhodococcus sp. 05-2256-B4]
TAQAPQYPRVSVSADVRIPMSDGAALRAYVFRLAAAGVALGSQEGVGLDGGHEERLDLRTTLFVLWNANRSWCAPTRRPAFCVLLGTFSTPVERRCGAYQTFETSDYDARCVVNVCQSE